MERSDNRISMISCKLTMLKKGPEAVLSAISGQIPIFKLRYQYCGSTSLHYDWIEWGKCEQKSDCYAWWGTYDICSCLTANAQSTLDLIRLNVNILWHYLLIYFDFMDRPLTAVTLSFTHMFITATKNHICRIIISFPRKNIKQ